MKVRVLRKIDIGLIAVQITDEERQQIDAIWSELKLQYPDEYKNEPNIVIDIYKNRRGEMRSVKVFRYFNYATLRCEDLFATDSRYRLITDLGKLKYDESVCDFLELKAKGVV